MRELSLRQVPLLASLSETDLAHLAKSLRPRQIAPGTVLCREGQHGDRLYIILSGQVGIFKTLADKDERSLNILGPGDFIGEMSLFDRKGLRTASARAITTLQVLEMTHADLDDLLHDQPVLAYEVIRELSLRLRNNDDAVIRDLQEKNRQLEQAYRELQEAHAQIVEKERLDRELQVARHIQQNILPTRLPTIRGFEFGARMIPARSVGGDFFDLIRFDARHVAICIGDVSGKGIPAAIFMALVQSLLRAEARPATPPARVLQRVNRHLLDMNNMELFVTVLYGVLVRDTGQFSYARAGHEIPLVVDSARETRQPGRSRGQPLGLLPQPDLDEQEVNLSPGDTLLLYTDGATDATDITGARLEFAGFKAAIRDRLSGTAQSTCDGIIEAIHHYRGAAPQDDDIALVAVHCDSPRRKK